MESVFNQAHSHEIEFVGFKLSCI